MHQELVASAPEVIFVAPCGYEQERAAKDTQALWRHDWWRALPAVKAGRVYALDANSYFARPGPRVVQVTVGPGLGIASGVGSRVGMNLPLTWYPNPKPKP